MKKIILGLICLLLLVGCNKPEPIYNDYFNVINITPRVTNCYGLYMSFSINNPEVDLSNITEREIKYYMLGTLDPSWYPLNVSFNGDCDVNNTIPDKIYKNFAEIPLEDDCYNENRCYVKWNITTQFIGEVIP